MLKALLDVLEDIQEALIRDKVSTPDPQVSHEEGGDADVVQEGMDAAPHGLFKRSQRAGMRRS